MLVELKGAAERMLRAALKQIQDKSAMQCIPVKKSDQ